MMDHWFQMEGFAPPQEPMLEGYTSLGFVAGKTKRLTLGLMVTGVTYRHPGLLAKIVTTLDVLSEGRALFGVGAAWYQREHEGLGVPYPPLSERFERLEETLQICKQMWSDDDGPYDGKHYHLAETICSRDRFSSRDRRSSSAAVARRKTLRLVARYADACNLFALGVDEVKRKLDILTEHCEAEGRDYDAIKKTMNGGGDPLSDVDGFLREMEQYAALGISLVEVRNVPPDPARFVSELGEKVLPRSEPDRRSRSLTERDRGGQRGTRTLDLADVNRAL